MASTSTQELEGLLRAATGTGSTPGAVAVVATSAADARCRDPR